MTFLKKNLNAWLVLSRTHLFQDDDESEDEEKENSLPDPQNFGRGRRSALIDHKLRTGENFTKKFTDRFFRIQVFFRSCSSLTVGLCNFYPKNVGAKAARKMSVKSTTGEHYIED
jgi:hypothetical protein